MKKNQLGTSELNISEIGLGCMSLGTDEAQAERIVHAALERGVNFLDTADLYDSGRNEEIVGKAIRGRRQDVVLATKLHGGTLDDPIDETIEAFEELKQEGVIRYYGISSIRPNVIREYVKRSGIVSVMSQYSILDRRPEEEVLPLLADNRISVIARGPVASGVLTEQGGAKVAKGYLDYSPDELIQIREQLQRLVKNDRSMGQTAIRYALANPVVATAIAGASSLEQLIHNTAAGDAPALTEEEIERIRSFSKANQYSAHR
ncbi:hypothetical protein BGX30_002829 [Mortierella sp. GBA39]|nr:hypothetical protein BGX30_002829 [Mortierella sp. GBA39]